MKRVLIALTISAVAIAGPVTTAPWANDAHHPEKAARTEKQAKPKQQERPAKTKKPKQSGMLIGLQAQRA